MDPISIAASVLAIATAAEQTRRALDRVRTALKTLPGRLSALNNQVTDLEVLLRQIASLMASRNDHPELVTTEAQDRIRDVIRRADVLLQELRDLSAKVEKAGDGHSRMGSIQRSRAWQRHLPRLHEIQDELSDLKSTINLLLGTSNSLDMMRIRLDLLAVTGLPHQESLSHDELLNQLFEYIDERIGGVKQAIQDQTREIERSQVALLHKASDPRIPPISQMPPPLYTSRRSSSSSIPRQSPGVTLAVAGRTNACRANCKCACHRTQKTATPSLLSRFLGQLFVEHAGIPVISTKCDKSTCVNAQGSQLYAEYWFPLGFFWSQIIRLHLTYQSNLGPSLQLRTLRRVPDSASAVNFAISGNIEGLQELFRRGAASPQDVSDTRGYSLIRWALYSRQYKMVRFLHAEGADVDYRPKALHDNSPSNKAADAIMMGGLSRDVVDALSCIANPDWVEEQNFPLLHRIVLGLHGKDLKNALIEDPGAIDNEDAMGRTALNWAAARGDDRSVTLLLSYGADPNILDCQYSGPLSYAAEKNHTVCVRLLLEAGAEPDPVISGGKKVGSPLNCASRNASDPVLVKSLLDFGADVDASGVDGRTPLIHAARTDNVPFALLFLQHNANINAMSTDKQTPLTTAIVNNSHGVLKLLLSRWSDYSACPRLRGPHLLETTAQFADHETLAILCTTSHIRLKRDINYHTGDFEKILHQRHDGDDKLRRIFADFLAIVREEVSPEALMEQGLGTVKDDQLSDEGSDEFFDSADHSIEVS